MKDEAKKDQQDWKMLFPRRNTKSRAASVSDLGSERSLALSSASGMNVPVTVCVPCVTQTSHKWRKERNPGPEGRTL